ncbi:MULTISPECIES: HAMP domain-containing sensor histidine kinase [Brevibacterium]|uniref:histidine kinase n=1 Tax=Brevibacterium antiquum CNRZ 918 TaxID=1255637 RepID=A0A2H1KVX6_9MICO|nr:MULTISPECIES: HAMP domain-containing sensor histidine kinase [Brevibacterium]SMY03841.1 Signal transduction histidine kinase [Brevibacterium antiquum CNRZ 918]HCG54711.1 sensor histidine kinase [Brevibacterium sp.]
MPDTRRGVTARTRILGWILLILTIAVSIIVVTTARAELSRVKFQAHAELQHEVEKFRDFATRPDPANGKAYGSVEELLTSHLQYNLPERSETFFTIIDGQESQRSLDNPPVRLDRDADFVARAAQVTDPEITDMTTDTGQLAYAVVPVGMQGGEHTAQLVVVEFLNPEYDEARSTIWTMTIIAVLALILVGLFGWLVAGRVLAPIRQLSETAASIGEEDLTRRIEVTGNDDVAHLGVAFNRMLDRLEAGFDGQRQFLDDAGHELRTPITVVRGHLDVMGDDPEDRRHTLDLVSDELRRMSRLVDELIMLAGSERPDFLVTSTTDLTDLVFESFTKATALGQRHWVIDATPEAFGAVDEQRLTQALLQLAANSIDHTDVNDTIAFGGRVGQGTIELWVRDTGSGVSSEEQERIFERFARGRRTKHGRRGTGLGLTIVDRIARAHGGSVSVSSVEGEGATFRIELPWHHAEEEDR